MYDVGLHAAKELGADKLIFMHTDDLGLPAWLPLSDAQDMLLNKLQARPLFCLSGGQEGGDVGGEGQLPRMCRTCRQVSCRQECCSRV